MYKTIIKLFFLTLIFSFCQNSEKEILQGILCKRFGKPEEIAYADAFLASPYAQYINGEV